MKYEQVIEKITDRFLRDCCDLSKFDLDVLYISAIQYLINDNGIYFRDRQKDVLYSFLFQAFFEWNKKYKNIGIELHHDSVEILRQCDEPELFYYYDDFESNKPLPPEIQALITALDYCFQMEGKG